MRGLHTLALALWEDGRSGARDEAIEIAKKCYVYAQTTILA
jgi:hypothetical protein